MEKIDLLKHIMSSNFNKSEKEVLSQLMRWCSNSEKCPTDVYQWFLRKKIPTDHINKFLDYLIEKQLN